MTRECPSEEKQEQIQACTKLLTDYESKELLRQAEIPIVKTKLARSRKEAVEFSKEVGFPVVLKISSPDIVHKSDYGGVKLGLTSIAQVGKAYDEIISSINRKFPKARIHGTSVYRMVPPGAEIIIGMNRDPQFGPVIMFGLGGILIEILKDVSFRIIPVTSGEAAEMIKEIKGYPLLQGYRGKEPVNIFMLADLIAKLSQFIEANPQIKELDLNPIIANKDSAIVVDARIVEDSQKATCLISADCSKLD